MQQTIATGVDKHCWIGLRRNGTGEYYWRSGRELNEFHFWKHGEPGSRECVSFHGTESEWETRDCSDRFDCFICMAGKLQCVNSNIIHSMHCIAIDQQTVCLLSSVLPNSTIGVYM